MNIEERSGITLITLVITIVVLLILSGVAIGQFTSEDGFLHSMSGIDQKAKTQLNEVDDKMQENIEDTLDTGVGANKAVYADFDFSVIDVWSTTASVELDIRSYGLPGDKSQYEIEGYSYAISKNSTYTDFKKSSDNEYTFENLTPGTSYNVSAWAEYRDNNRVLHREKIAEKTIKTVAHNFKKGDWVDYDAGVWTQSEITALSNAGLYYQDFTSYSNSIDDDEIPASLIVNKFSGMNVGTSKNVSQSHSKTGFSGKESSWSLNSYRENTVSSAVKNGWRILGVNNKGQVMLVSAGMPEYYLTRACYTTIGLRIDRTGGYSVSGFYVEQATLNGLNKRDFSQYVNNTYAESARMMTYDDVNMAKSVTNLAAIGGTYIQATVNKGSAYYSVSDALNKKIYGSGQNESWLTFYNKSFSDGDLYSAGLLGVRIVITLHPNIIPTNTDANGNALSGTVSSKLRLVDKSEIK